MPGRVSPFSDFDATPMSAGFRGGRLVGKGADRPSGSWVLRPTTTCEPGSIDYMNLMDGFNVTVDAPSGETLIVTLTVS